MTSLTSISSDEVCRFQEHPKDSTLQNTISPGVIGVASQTVFLTASFTQNYFSSAVSQMAFVHVAKSLSLKFFSCAQPDGFQFESLMISDTYLPTVQVVL